MATELSHYRSILTLNGTRLTGFPEDESPIEIEGQDLLSYTFGTDGTLYIEDTAVQGGEITVRLGQSSPSIPQIIGYNTRIKRGEQIDMTLTYGDPTLGYSVEASDGFMINSDVTTMPGATFEATFIFEKILGDADGSQFDPPPARE